ncbi:hypothetical protein QE152_g9325 [Popillia japonica]|uniref:Uncharacterized protein n=1 Tax=Popillia japonica TaxID=7064 RepID=A0AAW1LZS7_POPJA
MNDDKKAERKRETPDHRAREAHHQSGPPRGATDEQTLSAVAATALAMLLLFDRRGQVRGHGRANIERGGGDGSSDASFIRQAWASASCVDKEVMCTRSFLFSPRSYTPRAGLNYRNGIYKEYLRYNSGV